MNQEEAYKEVVEMLLEKLPSVVQKVITIRGMDQRWFLDEYDLNQTSISLKLIRPSYGSGCEEDCEYIYVPASVLWDDNWTVEYEQKFKLEVEKQQKESQRQKQTLAAEEIRKEKKEYERLKKRFESDPTT
jgi:hypothetical protein